MQALGSETTKYVFIVENLMMMMMMMMMMVMMMMILTITISGW